MAIRLAYHAITWGRDTLGALKDVSDLGFKGIECFTFVADQYGDNPSLFKRILADHGLRLVALYGGGKMLRETRKQDVERNRAIAEFIAACGGDRLNLGGGDRLRDPQGQEHWTQEHLKQLAETLTAIGQACLEVGVKAHYHPHVGTLGEEKANVDKIFGYADLTKVFAGPDPAHLFLGGYDPVQFFKKYINHIAYCHIKDVPATYTAQNWRAKYEQLRTAHSQDPAVEVVPLFCELGQGQLDTKAILQVLRDNNYDGWVTVEIDSTTQPSARASAEINKRYLQTCGFVFDR
jgi:inosose dehydratase